MINKSNRVAIVTGGNSGLGEAIVMELSRTHSHIVIVAKDSDRLRASVLNFREQAPHTTFEGHSLDLSNDIAIVTWCATIVNTHPKIDTLVNCAGVFHVEEFLETNIDFCKNMFNINFFAPFLLCQSIGKVMVENGLGNIVNIGSSSGYGAGPNTSAYVSSKHALLGLTRSLNAEWKKFGVRAVYVAPGSMQTPMGELVPGQDYSTFIEPKAVARLISNILSDSGNMAIDEIQVGRMLYK